MSASRKLVIPASSALKLEQLRLDAKLVQVRFDTSLNLEQKGRKNQATKQYV